MSSPENQTTYTLTSILDFLADLGNPKFQQSDGIASLTITCNNGIFSFEYVVDQPNATQASVTNANFLAASQAIGQEIIRYVAPPTPLGG